MLACCLLKVEDLKRAQEGTTAKKEGREVTTLHSLLPTITMYPQSKRLLLILSGLGVATGFQALTAGRVTRHGSSMPRLGPDNTVALRLSSPQFPPPGDDFEDTSSPPSMKEEANAPQKASLIKEIGFKATVLVATVAAFVIIQKLGLSLSETLTPELSAEDIANFKM